MDTSSLALALSLNTPVVGDDRRTDLVFSIELKNTSQKPIEVYPGRARLSAVSGWGGPTFALAIEDDHGAAGALRELRTWYGPPGQPPGAGYFKEGRVRLAPGQSRTHALTACFIPRAQLPAAELTRAALDPEGMDGVRDAEITGRSVLVMQQTCAELARRAPGQLLRPGVVAFVRDASSLRFRVGYAQAPWIDFQPAMMSAESNAASLRVERAVAR